MGQASLSYTVTQTQGTYIVGPNGSRKGLPISGMTQA